MCSQLPCPSCPPSTCPSRPSADAVGMGLNLSIRRIVFTSLRKFDGTHERLLITAEIKQVGWAVCPRPGGQSWRTARGCCLAGWQGWLQLCSLAGCSSLPCVIAPRVLPRRWRGGRGALAPASPLEPSLPRQQRTWRTSQRPCRSRLMSWTQLSSSHPLPSWSCCMGSTHRWVGGWVPASGLLDWLRQYWAVTHCAAHSNALC
jgi:hypothetical protein